MEQKKEVEALRHRSLDGEEANLHWALASNDARGQQRTPSCVTRTTRINSSSPQNKLHNLQINHTGLGDA